MNIDEAKRIMVDACQDQIAALDSALERYKRFSGIYMLDDYTDEVAADRAAYPDLLRFSEGMPVLSDDRCVAFMVAVSGLSASLCAAWNEIDFMDEHSDLVSPA